MTSRTSRFSLAVLAVLALSACTAPAGADEASSGPGGVIEMAISEECTEAADPECVSVNGTSIVLPTEFEQAGVENASVVDDGQNSVVVTFTDKGADVLHSLTEKAVDAGDSVRLVIQIGGELRAAVVVMEALPGDAVQIGLSPEVNAQEIVDLLQAG